jgi:hypothetical protein
VIDAAWLVVIIPACLFVGAVIGHLLTPAEDTRTDDEYTTTRAPVIELDFHEGKPALMLRTHTRRTALSDQYAMAMSDDLRKYAMSTKTMVEVLRQDGIIDPPKPEKIVKLHDLVAGAPQPGDFAHYGQWERAYREWMQVKNFIRKDRTS